MFRSFHQLTLNQQNKAFPNLWWTLYLVFKMSVIRLLQVFAVFVEVFYGIILYLMVPDVIMWYEEYKGDTKPPAEPVSVPQAQQNG